MKTVCWCGRKATYNARLMDGHVVKAGAQIVPIYIDRRPHWYNRQRYMVGEPIAMQNASGARATLMDINRLTEELYQKELKLKSMMIEYNTNKRRK